MSLVGELGPSMSAVRRGRRGLVPTVLALAARDEDEREHREQREENFRAQVPHDRVYAIRPDSVLWL